MRLRRFRTTGRTDSKASSSLHSRLQPVHAPPSSEKWGLEFHPSPQPTLAFTASDRSCGLDRHRLLHHTPVVRFGTSAEPDSVVLVRLGCLPSLDVLPHHRTDLRPRQSGSLHYARAQDDHSEATELGWCNI